MDKSETGKLYLVHQEALPEVLFKTLQAKELIKRGLCSTVNDAVTRVGLSRAAYYKYRNLVFPFHELSQGKIITLSLLLEHIPGVLSEILSRIAKSHGNILTINQGIPLQGLANVTISIDTEEMSVNVEALLQALQKTTGVRKTEILGQE